MSITWKRWLKLHFPQLHISQKCVVPFKAFRPKAEELEDRQLLAPLTVTNTKNDGPGSFRQAILDSNSTPAVLDTISFRIGEGLQTIMPAMGMPLDKIIDPVVIDATAPGTMPTQVIRLDGSNTGANASGLRISAGKSTVRALVITKFTEHGIILTDKGENKIEGCYIGTDKQGQLNLGNGKSGILIDGTTTDNSQNTIGNKADLALKQAKCVGLARPGSDPWLARTLSGSALQRVQIC